MKYQSRSYQGQGDLHQMIALLSDVCPRGWEADYPSIRDLQEIMENGEVQKNTMLWLTPDAQILCFAFVDQYTNLRYELRAECYETPIATEVFHFGVKAARQSGYSALSTNSRTEDTARVQALKENGFLEQAARTLTFTHDLSQSSADIGLAAGFSIRPLAGSDEVEAVVKLHQAAFGTSHMSEVERRLMMSSEDYDPALDLVIVGPNEALAAYCLAVISCDQSVPDEKPVGFIDTIATHPRFQGNGLARSLLLTQLNMLKQRGLTLATLGTLNQNKAMVALAQTTGFTLSYQRVWFEKIVS